MPYHFEVIKDRRIFRVVLEGVVSDAEMTAAYSSAARVAADLRPAAFITDTTDVTDFNVSAETVRYLASLKPAAPAPESGNLPRFLVAPIDYIYGMARMFQGWGDKTREGMKTVRSLREAYRQLGLPDDVVFERVAA